MSIEHILDREERDDVVIRDELFRIRLILERAFPKFLHVNVFQFKLDGGFMSAGTIKGIPVGGTGTFGETDPSGFTDPSGAVRTWATSDTTNTALTPSTDALVSKVSVAVGPNAPVGGSFTLTFTDTSATGTVLTTSGAVTVPFLPAVAVTPLDDVVNQLS